MIPQFILNKVFPQPQPTNISIVKPIDDNNLGLVPLIQKMEQTNSYNILFFNNLVFKPARICLTKLQDNIEENQGYISKAVYLGTLWGTFCVAGSMANITMKCIPGYDLITEKLPAGLAITFTVASTVGNLMASNKVASKLSFYTFNICEDICSIIDARNAEYAPQKANIVLKELRENNIDIDNEGVVVDVHPYNDMMVIDLKIDHDKLEGVQSCSDDQDYYVISPSDIYRKSDQEYCFIDGSDYLEKQDNIEGDRQQHYSAEGAEEPQYNVEEAEVKQEFYDNSNAVSNLVANLIPIVIPIESEEEIECGFFQTIMQRAGDMYFEALDFFDPINL